MAKRGNSKGASAVIAFLLGILFAFIVEVAALVGAFYYVMNADLEDLLSAVGLDNTDEDGEKKYVNTNEVKTLKELVNFIYDTATDYGSITVDKLENVIPATTLLMDEVYKVLDPYADLDKEAFEAAVPADMVNVLVDGIMSIRTAKLILDAGMTDFSGENSNLIVRTMLMGVEADYVGIGAPLAREGEPAAYRLELPVFYDSYTYDDVFGYQREYPAYVDGSPEYSMPSNLAGRESEYFYKSSTEDDGGLDLKKYRLYYIACRVTEHGIEEPEYVSKLMEVRDGDKTRKFNVLDFGEDTDFVYLKYSDGDYVVPDEQDVVDDKFSSALTYFYDPAYAREMYYQKTASETNASIINRVICGVNFFYDSEGEMINVSPVTIYSLSNDPYGPLDSVKVTEVVGKDNELTKKIFKNTTLGELMRNEVKLDELTEDMLLSDFIDDVEPDNDVMAFFVYKLTDIVQQDSDPDTYDAVYDKRGENARVTFTVREAEKNGEIKRYIDNVVYADTGLPVTGTYVNEVSDLAAGVSLDMFMNIDAEDAVMAYLGYGITDVLAAEPGAGPLVYYKLNEDSSTDELEYAYTHTGRYNNAVGSYMCFINTDADGTIINAKFYNDLNATSLPATLYVEDIDDVSPTAINDVSVRIGNVMEYVTLPGILKKVDVSQSIMVYVSYGVYGVKEVADPTGLDYKYTGKIKLGETQVEDPVTHEITTEDIIDTVYISVKPSSEDPNVEHIAAIWRMVTPPGGTPAKQYVGGTKVDGVADRVEGLKSYLTIGEIVDVEGNKILTALKDSTITSLGDDVKTLKVGDILEESDIESSTILKQLRHTSIQNLSTQIDALSIQVIYSKEVYSLPADDDPMQAVAFDATLFYYETQSYVEDGETRYAFVKANGTGHVSEAEFISRGSKCYYTLGETTERNLSAPLPEGMSWKIATYRLNGGAVEDLPLDWLFYELQPDGSFLLTHNEESSAVLRGRITAADISSGVYYTYGQAQKMWKLVLYAHDPDATGDPADGVDDVEKSYTLNNFHNMVGTSSYNVFHATLGELQDCGIIEQDVKGKTFTYYTESGGVYTPNHVNLEEMTFSELIDLVLSMSS